MQCDSVQLDMADIHLVATKKPFKYLTFKTAKYMLFQVSYIHTMLNHLHDKIHQLHINDKLMLWHNKIIQKIHGQIFQC